MNQILIWKQTDGGAWELGPYSVVERIDDKGWNASALIDSEELDILIGGTLEEAKNAVEQHARSAAASEPLYYVTRFTLDGRHAVCELTTGRVVLRDLDAAILPGAGIDAYYMPTTKPYGDEVKVQRSRQLDGSEKWAVRKLGECLNKQGEWEWEPMPSSRDDEFIARCRFDSAQEAIDAARRVAKQ
jgi:hypothetical protein